MVGKRGMANEWFEMTSVIRRVISLSLLAWLLLGPVF